MIKELLKTGRDNAITGKELAQLLGLDGRTITALVEKERLSGVPICAACDGRQGYYLAENMIELQDYIGRLSHRATKMLNISRALKETLREMPDYNSEQLKLLETWKDDE